MHGAAPPIAEVAQYCRVPHAHRHQCCMPRCTHRSKLVPAKSPKIIRLFLYYPSLRLTVEQIGRINSILKRTFKYEFFFSQLFSFLDVADDADQTLFNSMLKNNNVSQVILPEVKTSSSLSIYDRKVTCYGV